MHDPHTKRNAGRQPQKAIGIQENRLCSTRTSEAIVVTEESRTSSGFAAVEFPEAMVDAGRGDGGRGGAEIRKRNAKESGKLGVCVRVVADIFFFDSTTGYHSAPSMQV